MRDEFRQCVPCMPHPSPPLQPDVLVIGGGSAGVAAAIAAARQGAETLLVEHFGYLGGAGTASLVHSFCGLYDLAGQVANAGLPAELEERLRAEGIGERRRMGRVEVLMHSPQALAAFYDRWCAVEPRLTVMLHAQVVEAQVEGDRVAEVRVFCRGSSFVVRPKRIVDASGDATLAALTGQPFEMTAMNEVQRTAYIVGLSGVQAGALDADAPFQVAGILVKAVQAGNLPPAALGTHLRAGVGGNVFVTVDLPDACDGTETADLTRIEMQGRETVFAVVNTLRAECEGFAKAEVCALPARAGIRESRRWVGEAVLSEDDLLSSQTTEFDVAYATWPMELRETARGPKLLYPPDSRPCGIPLGVLRAKQLRNVFTAGRCISTTHRAQASTRVMGTALATGQAAGIAATLDDNDTNALAREVIQRLA